jgi:hypothetical protein
MRKFEFIRNGNYYIPQGAALAGQPAAGRKRSHFEVSGFPFSRPSDIFLAFQDDHGTGSTPSFAPAGMHVIYTITQKNTQETLITCGDFKTFVIKVFYDNFVLERIFHFDPLFKDLN